MMRDDWVEWPDSEVEEDILPRDKWIAALGVLTAFAILFGITLLTPFLN